MTDTLTINLDDVEALAAKLESLLDQFDDAERAALEALFHLAGAAVHESGGLVDDVAGFSASWAQRSSAGTGSKTTKGVLTGLHQSYRVGAGGGAGTTFGGGGTSTGPFYKE